MSRCADCKQEKSYREFSKRPDGTPVAYCKPCAAIRARGYRKAKRDRVDEIDLAAMEAAA